MLNCSQGKKNFFLSRYKFTYILCPCSLKDVTHFCKKRYFIMLKFLLSSKICRSLYFAALVRRTLHVHTTSGPGSHNLKKTYEFFVVLILRLKICLPYNKDSSRFEFRIPAWISRHRCDIQFFAWIYEVLITIDFFMY